MARTTRAKAKNKGTKTTNAQPRPEIYEHPDAISLLRPDVGHWRIPTASKLQRSVQRSQVPQLRGVLVGVDRARHPKELTVAVPLPDTQQFLRAEMSFILRGLLSEYLPQSHREQRQKQGLGARRMNVDYSHRKATIGSTDTARRAGR